LDIRQLRYFVTIAEEGKITAAAKRLNMAQPPLSIQLKLMEEELEVVLIERDKKHLNLTPEGEVLLKRAKEILNKFDDSMGEVRELRKKMSGTLSVGSTLYCASLMLSKVLAIREKNPHVSFKVWQGESIHLKDLLEKRKIEIAITNSSLTLSDVSTMRIAVDPYVLVLPEILPEIWKWELTQKVGFADIVNLPLILLRPTHGMGVYGEITAEFQRLNLKPNILCECQDLVMLHGLISAGFGATILPLSVLSLNSLDNLRIVEFINPLISEPTLIWKKNSYLSKIAKEFITLFSEI
jgi:LysR family transcriptional regulator, salicylic acid-responsive activator of bsdBCD